MTPFEARFGRAAEASARAPGRVNLIGEHIDYNGGSVLPTPIPRHACVDLAAREDRWVRVASPNLEPSHELGAYELDAERGEGIWIDFVQGVTRALSREGHEIGGFDALIDSSVPIGRGLASSAALTVALLRALRRRFDLRLDDDRIAAFGQHAENELVGARVGVMDPLVSSLGKEGYALLIDTRRHTYRHVRIPTSVEVVVIDSGTAHRHADGEYNLRREQRERARDLLGVDRLCDLSPADRDRIEALPEPLGRRALHAVTENERVHAAVRALEEGRLPELGEALRESHRSLREDFEVSTDALDRLVGLLDAEEGILGARLTGGGFGGSVVALARAGRGLEAATRAADSFSRETGHAASVIVPPPPRVATSASESAGRATS